jgi:Ca-activated chloride channel family protein
MGVRVFPILVGKGGVVPYPDGVDLLGRPSYRPVKLDVNPELLREIAEITGGASVTATDRKELEGGLQAVLDRMEKTRIIEATAGSQVAELFPRALLPAFLLAALGLVLGLTRWRAFP